MKKSILLCIVLLQTSFLCLAQQNATYLWSLKGVEAGQNILYKPNEYINKEHNFCDLFLTAPEGTEILAPTDGTVTSYSYIFHESLTYCNDYGGGMSENFENDKKDYVESGDISEKDIKYLCVSMGITTASGKVIYMNFYPVRIFKTGEKIKRGDVIGRMGYSYKNIKQPSLKITMSEKTLPVDPMTPFGLKTTFKKPEPPKQVNVLSPEEAKQDFEIFVNALKEAHTGLYDYMSEQEFENYIAQTLHSFTTPVKIFDFEKILLEIISKIKDSHTGFISRPHTNTGMNLSTVQFGWLNDSLIVTRVLEQDKQYYGKRVLEVDGIPADSLKKIIAPYMKLSEGLIESFTDFEFLLTAWYTYFQYAPDASRQCNVTLKFEDGSTKFFKGYEYRGQSMGFFPKGENRRKFIFTNQYENKNMALKKLSDTTAYMGLSTFYLNDVEMEEIVAFMKSVSDSNYKNLIIDVRNNAGGSDEVCAKIFSYIAKQPFKMSEFSKVNKQGQFSSFKNCMNYTSDMDLFPEFAAVDGKDGFYLMNDVKIFPDSSINFKGKIYILTNENSFSASALLASLIYKYKRGAVVGREAGTTYYQMNAVKFADMRLPNSWIDIRLPLMKIVFTSELDAGIPWGRGVLPDYPLPFTLEEIDFENGDAILNYALKLIEDGKYIKESEEFEIDIVKMICLIAAGFVVVGAASLLFYNYNRKRKIKNKKHL